MASKGKKDDDEYVPSDGTESESDFEAEVVDGEELGQHKSEVGTPDGKAHVVDGAPLTAEEAEAKENEIINAVKQSRHFRNLTVRRKIRFASIVDYYKDAWKLREQAVLDFSDTAKVSKATDKGLKFDYIPCKHGKYVEVEVKGKGKGKSNEVKLRELTEEEMASMDSGDASPCNCEVCELRRKNDLERPQVLEVGLRSGEKRAWEEKYGVGRRL